MFNKVKREDALVNKRVNLKQIMRFAGAFMAFLIGSGFATGQEIMQYFVAYGYKGIVGICFMFILFLYVGVSFISLGYEHKNSKIYDIYKYYCGNDIGKFFNYFTIAFSYMSVVVMIAGAGATLKQQFGLPIYFGCIIMAILSVTTVIFGLNKILDIIGKIGPLIAMMSILLGITAIIKNPNGIIKANEVIPALKIMKASNNWLLSSCSYVGLSILWLASFLSSMGSTANSKKEAVLGAVLGVTVFSFAVMAVALGFLANIKQVAGTMIPSLVLAKNIHISLAKLFSLTIIAGIYTTAVPLLWTVCNRVVDESTRKFKFITIILAVFATFIALNVSFDKLINIVYGFNGYIGLIFLVFVFLKAFK